MIYWSGIFCGSEYELHLNDIIAVDFDGTLAQTFEPFDPHKVGPPVPKMVRQVRHWLKQGKKVVILTARMNSSHTPKQLRFTRKLIDAWCKKFIGEKLPITSEKHHRMAVIYDDRAVQVKRNKGEFIR